MLIRRIPTILLVAVLVSGCVASPTAPDSLVAPANLRADASATVPAEPSSDPGHAATTASADSTGQSGRGGILIGSGTE